MYRYAASIILRFNLRNSKSDLNSPKRGIAEYQKICGVQLQEGRRGGERGGGSGNDAGVQTCGLMVRLHYFLHLPPLAIKISNYQINKFKSAVVGNYINAICKYNLRIPPIFSYIGHTLQ